MYTNLNVNIQSICKFPLASLFKAIDIEVITFALSLMELVCKIGFSYIFLFIGISRNYGSAAFPFYAHQFGIVQFSFNNTLSG